MDKKEIDSLIGGLIKTQLDAGGEYPKEIVISPSMKRKFEWAIPPSPHPTTMMYDDIPIRVDETLPGEQILLWVG